MRAVAVLAVALVAAGCGGREGGNAVETDGAGVEAEIVDDGAAPMSWRYAGSDEAPEARFAAGEGPPRFVLRCDREGQQLRLRHAPSPTAAPDAPLIVAVGGEQRSFPLTPSGEMLEATILLADPFVGTMAARGARLRVALGSDPAAELPGGAAIRRTVDACRSPVEERMAGAVFAGLIPGEEEIVLMFEGATPGPGRAVALFRPVGAGPVTRVVGTVVADVPLGAPVFRFDPEEAGGRTLWFETPDPQRLILRGRDGIPDPVFDANPLARRR